MCVTEEQWIPGIVESFGESPVVLTMTARQIQFWRTAFPRNTRASPLLLRVAPDPRAIPPPLTPALHKQWTTLSPKPAPHSLDGPMPRTT